MGEGLRLEAVAGRQVEVLQRGTSLRDDLQTGLIQEVAAGQFQAAEAETTGLHKAEGDNRWRGRGVRGCREKQMHHNTSVSILDTKPFNLTVFAFVHEFKNHVPPL